MRKTLILMVLLAGTGWAQASDQITARVVSVIDGNTLEIVGSDNEKRKILLADIDSPELTQEYGEKARKFLEKMMLEKTVTVEITGQDRKGTPLAIVKIENKDPRYELLKEGLAWTAERNPLPDLEEIRAKAQEKGKGLWKQGNPTPPWTYRREQTMLTPKSS
jgi:endonuclease YncB( thermonuclease family)